MTKCDHCGTTILFGGVHQSGYRFCNAACRDNAHQLMMAAAQIPEELVLEQARQLHGGKCPKCAGRGPVDIHWKHSVWSAFVVTHWRSTPFLSCEACGTKSKFGAIAFSAMFGWWGMPWGLVITPMQVGRNIKALFATPDPAEPSAELIQFVRRNLSVRLLSENRRLVSAAA
jgi:hypothetical protein